MRTLIVDDDLNTRALLVSLCRRAGMDADTAENGEEAMPLIRTNEYAAIILDLWMPRKSGFDVLTEMRTRHPEMLERTIIFTAASEQVTTAFDSSRVFTLVHKPAQSERLLDVVRACASQPCLLPSKSPRGRKSPNAVR